MNNGANGIHAISQSGQRATSIEWQCACTVQLQTLPVQKSGLHDEPWLFNRCAVFGTWSGGTRPRLVSTGRKERKRLATKWATRSSPHFPNSLAVCSPRAPRLEMHWPAVVRSWLQRHALGETSSVCIARSLVTPRLDGYALGPAPRRCRRREEASRGCRASAEAIVMLETKWEAEGGG